jgi:hypothetical protein
MCVEFFRIAIVELILDPAIQWIQWVSWCVWSFLHNCDCGANLKPCNTISLLHVCEVFSNCDCGANLKPYNQQSLRVFFICV